MDTENECVVVLQQAYLRIKDLLCDPLALTLLPHSRHTCPHSTVRLTEPRWAHERFDFRGYVLS